MLNGCVNSNEPMVELVSLGFFSTDAVTSLTFGLGNTTMDANFGANSRFSLYGIKGA